MIVIYLFKFFFYFLGGGVTFGEKYIITFCTLVISVGEGASNPLRRLAMRYQGSGLHLDDLYSSQQFICFLLQHQLDCERFEPRSHFTTGELTI